MDLVGVEKAYSGPVDDSLGAGTFSDAFSEGFDFGAPTGTEIIGIYCGTVFVWPDPWTDLWDEGHPVAWDPIWRDQWSSDPAPPAVEEE